MHVYVFRNDSYKHKQKLFRAEFHMPAKQVLPMEADSIGEIAQMIHRQVARMQHALGATESVRIHCAPEAEMQFNPQAEKPEMCGWPLQPIEISLLFAGLSNPPEGGSHERTARP